MFAFWASLKFYQGPRFLIFFADILRICPKQLVQLKYIWDKEKNFWFARNAGKCVSLAKQRVFAHTAGKAKTFFLIPDIFKLE